MFAMQLKAWLPLAVLACIAVAPRTAAAAEPDRLREAADVVRSLRAVPDNGIPDDLWQRAECVVVIPSMKKAAFVFGGEYGRGVMTCRSGNGWSAPLFMQLAKGSWGLQIGAEAVDLVLLVVNHKGIDTLLDNKVTLGADASIAAGPVGRAGTAATDAQLNAQILSYSRSKGLFAGIDLLGGVLRPDRDANKDFYRRSVGARDVLFGTMTTTDAAAREFATALGANTGVRATTGR
jgi:lipid-binding SYLF domain-containing protein